MYRQTSFLIFIIKWNVPEYSRILEIIGDNFVMMTNSYVTFSPYNHIIAFYNNLASIYLVTNSYCTLKFI
jgi:hypothetical protein